jgi:hypothetical protein
VDFREIDSFRSFAAQKGITPPTYHRGMEAIAGVDLLLTIEQLGDRVLALARSKQLSPSEAERLLIELAGYYNDPLQQTRLIARIGSELRGYES